MNIFDKILSKIRGNTSPRIELLKLMPENSICAEIGVWKGDFSKKILETVSPKQLHLIDPWKYQTSFGNRLFGGKVAKNQDDMDKIFKQVVDQLSTYDCVKFHRDFSDKIHVNFSNDFFDWVYIDGNHYYEYVLNDINNFATKVKKDGFLTGDDYLWTSKELNGDKPVMRAVKKFVDVNKNFVLHKIIEDQFIIKRVK